LVFAPAYADPEEVYVEGYLLGKSQFGLDVTHPLFQEYLAWVADRRLETIEKVVGPPGRFLDVGCGSGEVLAVAERRGWKVQGAEPVIESAELAQRRGLDVRAARLEESGLPEHSYDVVGAFHVLEHMVDGAGFLRTIARWARPGGHVVVEVPNFRSFHRRNHGRGLSWSGLRPLEHLAHYSPATLAATMREVGITPVSITTPGYIYYRQTLDQSLDDLGLQRWRRLAGWMGKPGEQKGQPAVVANQIGSAVLHGVQSLYRMTGTGMVVFAVGQVA
jgi:SAM-dependent methyltransferase